MSTLQKVSESDFGAANQSLPVANYGDAVARAVEWLGDRYLLAKPINVGPARRATLAVVSSAAHLQSKSPALPRYPKWLRQSLLT
jgi:hypothetical protein